MLATAPLATFELDSSGGIPDIRLPVLLWLCDPRPFVTMHHGMVTAAAIKTTIPAVAVKMTRPTASLRNPRPQVVLNA